MGRIIGQIILLIILSCGLAWAAGVRVHPEAVQGHLTPPSLENYYKVELSTGGTLVGELIEETEGQVRLVLEDAIITFTRAEMRDIKPISPSEMKSDSDANWVFRSHKKSLLSYSGRRNRFILIKNRLEGRMGGGVSMKNFLMGDVGDKMDALSDSGGMMQQAMELANQASMQNRAVQQAASDIENY